MRLLFLAALAFLASVYPAVHAAAPKPNIILIVADDFGYECVSANGGQSYQTPQLDRLAAEGIRFEQCHVQPLCTPTRVQLMTGRYNVRNYLNFGTLLRTETTFAHLLKQAGYATGICGKWQLGREKDSPQHFGFDESCLWQHTRRPSRYANPGLEYNGVERDFQKGEYGPDLVNAFALDFITRHSGAGDAEARAREKPFFLYYPMLLTHAPFQPTPDSAEWDPTARGEDVKKNVKHFAEMTAYMDNLIGHLDVRLGEMGVRDNTLLLFIGDNGSDRSVTSRFRGGDFNGGKGTTTQRGTHVPMVASWPAVMKNGARVTRDLISSTDFLPTMCEAAGVPAPPACDGVSFLPQLRGEAGKPREWLYSWYSPRQGADLTVREFAFTQDHKLYRTGRFFDLAADPFEEKPLDVAALDSVQTAALGKLQKVLEQFKTARPAELDRQLDESATGEPAPEKKKRRKRNK